MTESGAILVPLFVFVCLVLTGNVLKNARKVNTNKPK